MTAIRIMPCKKNGGVKKMRIMMRTMKILALMILMKMIMKICNGIDKDNKDNN